MLRTPQATERFGATIWTRPIELTAGAAGRGANNCGNAVFFPGKPVRSVGTFVGTVASLGQEVQYFRA